MFAAYAVASALFWRERDPERRGQLIDTSMLGGQVALLTYQAGRYFATDDGATAHRQPPRQHRAVRDVQHRRRLRERGRGQRADVAAFLQGARPRAAA